MKRIEGENISKLYGKGEAAVAAVREASFTIEAGEFVAIVGESGSGNRKQFGKKRP